MSINFKATVTAGTNYYDLVYVVGESIKRVFEHTTKDVVSTLDLGNCRIMRSISSYSSQDGMGEQTMTGAECIQWLNAINTLHGHFAQHYIEEVMRSFKEDDHYVSVLIEWC